MTLFVGVDGGGTKTQACFFDSATKACFYLEGHPSRTSSIGWTAAQEVIRSLIEQGIERFGKISKDDIAAMSLCLSGIDLDEQSVRMKNEFQPFFPNSRIEVVNDALAVLTAGTGGQSGLVLIVGTGSVCAAENRSGEFVRAGGYGSLIGDEGSGYEIGRQGLLAAIRYAEGRGTETALWERAQSFYHVSEPDYLIPRVYGSSYPVAQVAEFAPTVLKTACVDLVARSILDEAVSSYAGLIRSVHARAGHTTRRLVVLSGGLLSSDDELANRLLERLRLATPEFEFRVLRERPSYGAVLRAIRLTDRPPEEDRKGIPEETKDAG